MWERLLIGLAAAGIGWAQKKIDERAAAAARDKAASDALHEDNQKPVIPPGGSQ